MRGVLNPEVLGKPGIDLRCDAYVPLRPALESSVTPLDGSATTHDQRNVQLSKRRTEYVTMNQVVSARLYLEIAKDLTEEQHAAAQFIDHSLPADGRECGYLSKAVSSLKFLTAGEFL